MIDGEYGAMTKQNKNCPCPKDSSSGFSLIEVAIGLIILGLFILPFIQTYKAYIENKKITESEQRIAVIQSALQSFALRYGRYPAPANKNRSQADTDFGVEDFPSTPPACTPTSLTVCRTNGVRDVLTPAGLDPVLVGDVPFATLGLPVKFSSDHYNRKFTYAVSEYLTSPVTFDDGAGVLRVLDKSNADTTGTSSNAHYVLVNHGDDARGAVNNNGIMSFACTGAGRDIENCDNDAVFTNNYALFGVSPNSYQDRYYSFTNDADHYDDYIGYRTTTTGDTWSITANSPNIFNRNSGNIRIGNWAVAASPKAKIDVAGQSGDPGNVSADRIDANRICTYEEETTSSSLDVGCVPASSTAALSSPNIYPGKVFTPSVIGGNVNPANQGKVGGGILCTTGYALTDIKYVDEVCASRQIPLGTVTVSAGCSTTGVGGRKFTGGQLICTPP